MSVLQRAGYFMGECQKEKWHQVKQGQQKTWVQQIAEVVVKGWLDSLS